MFCWGKNDDHEMATPDAIVSTPHAHGAVVLDAALGSAHICVVDSSKRIVCAGNPIAARQPPSQLLWTSMAAGDLHTCARTPDTRARVGCFGANTRGQCTGTQPVVLSVQWVEF